MVPEKGRNTVVVCVCVCICGVRVCSNNGGDAITERTMNQWINSLPREQLQLFDMEEVLILRVFNKQGEELQPYFLVIYSRIKYCTNMIGLILMHCIQLCIMSYF